MNRGALWASTSPKRVYPRPRWMESAACEGMGITGPALFYDFDLEQDAKAVCETCPVREPCLEHALIYKEVGVWGGKSEKERRTIIRRRRRAAAAS